MSPQRPEQVIRPLSFAAVAALVALQAQALTLEFPAPASGTADVTRPLDSYRLPTGAWAGEAVPARVVEGQVQIKAWRVDAPETPTLALMQVLRGQLEAAGFRILFECESAACGGFDFRFGTEVLPEPDMHVDLGDYRFLSASRGADAVALLVSRSSNAGFVQLTQVSPQDRRPEVLIAAAPTEAVIAPSPGVPALVGEGQTVTLSAAGGPPPDVGAMLARDGMAQLPDLRFPTGSSTLEDSPYPSLSALADWLRANPAATVALVGHTDASGGLTANIAVSRARAQSVRERLVSRYGIPGAQVEAEGVGYLAPRAANDTEEGRQANRRVEVVVTSTP